MKLSVQQVTVLRALDQPNGDVGFMFWRSLQYGRGKGNRAYGARRTLGSLKKRGLVEFMNEGWQITDKGREVLEEAQ